MPTTRRSKAIKTPEFIESDTEGTNDSGDYADEDKYVSGYSNIFASCSTDLYSNASDSEVSEEEAIEYKSSLLHVHSWIIYTDLWKLHQARRKSRKPPQ